MTKLLASLCALALFSAAPAYAESNTQQTKMKDCNAEAKTKNLEGDPRKEFMKTCLSNAPKPKVTQQEKMKTCNADAKTKNLEGEPRKEFMKTCLSNK